MAWRWRKSIKVLPGVRINLSRSGVSTSLGPRGFTHNIGHGKRQTTVGLPGSGLSYTATHRPAEDRGASLGSQLVRAVLMLVAIVVLGSFLF